jgi:hypothetical protein
MTYRLRHQSEPAERILDRLHASIQYFLSLLFPPFIQILWI